MKRLVAIAGVLVTFLLSSLTVLAQTHSREELLQQIKSKRGDLVELENRFLAPDQDDLRLYADFLRAPDTGLIRLLPREKFDSPSNTDDKRAIVIRGGGAYYSFTRLTHEYGKANDLELQRNEFQVGFAGFNFGFLTNLGDVPLENISSETSVVVPFAAYQAPREETLARAEERRFDLGAEIEGVPVKRTVPVKLNSTYLLRSINYRESDVLVGFRVVRIDSDGSVTILWKLLQKYETPNVNRAETAAVRE